MGDITATRRLRRLLLGVIAIAGTAFGAGTADGARQPSGGSSPTITTLDSSLNPSVVGDAVTFTATVFEINGRTPVGLVDFFDVTTNASLGAVALDTDAVARVTTTVLAPGAHTIEARYLGGPPGYAPSSDSLVQQVNTIPTTTSLTSSLNPSTVGDAVTFTATVSAGGALTPIGTVQFVDTTAGIMGTVALDGNGQATLTTTALTAGPHPIEARYSPETRFGSSSGSLTQLVNPISTTTTSTTTTTTTSSTSTTSTTSTSVPTTSVPPTSVVVTDPPDTTRPPRTSVPPAGPTASLLHATISPGDVQTGFGAGFQPGETVVAEQHSTPLGLGTQTAASDGSVTFTWTIRSGETSGTHTFVLTGSESGIASATFTVLAPGTLPTTGADTDVVVLLAATAVAAGALCLVRVGRRTAVR